MSFSSQIFLVRIGGNRDIQRKPITALPHDSNIISPRDRSRSIKIAIIAPDTAPLERICFQFRYSPNV